MISPDPPTFRVLPEPSEQTGHGWPLTFVIVALLALGLVPLAVGRQVAEVERKIEQVLEPARQYALDLALVHARQIARFQTYLLTGDSRALAFYQEARGGEQSLYAALVALSDQIAENGDSTTLSLELDVRTELAALSAASSAWHVLHAPALTAAEGRQAYLADLGQEQVRNEALLEASRALTDAISAATEEGRARADRARDLQLWLTIALVVVALAATAMVSGIGRRLRTLISEAREQRASAVRARREVDAVLEATGDGVMVLSRDGRCVSLNRSCARLLQCEPEELRDTKVHEALHAEGEGGHAREDCPLLRAVADGATVRETQDRFRRADGSVFPVQWTVAPLEDGLRVKGAVLTFTDMSEIQAAQDALRQAVRARDEVVAVVSHDLRNPLGTIAAAAGLMLEIELSAEVQREHLEMIVRATERMNRLMRDLLDIARIESGALSVDPAEVDPAELVDEALDLLRPLARERGLELTHRVEPDLPRVWADGDRVLQVLSNLVGNAVKFTRQGGVRLEVEGRGDEVMFSVHDTGPGIAPEGLTHVFDRFWQQSRSDKQGSGLGLAIVHGIVTAHGGRIWVESRAGEGSTFRFTLPRARTRGGVPAVAAAASG